MNLKQSWNHLKNHLKPYQFMKYRGGFWLMFGDICPHVIIQVYTDDYTNYKDWHFRIAHDNPEWADDWREMKRNL